MVGEAAFRRTLESGATLQRPAGFCGAAGGYELTFAVAVGASEDGAFLDAAERLEEAPHVVFGLLLVEHAHKELSVFWKEATRVTVRGAEMHTQKYTG